LTVGDNASALNRTVRLSFDADIRRATARDLAALGTWSGQVEGVFRPALEREDRLLLVATANGGFPIGHVLVNLGGVMSHLLVLNGFRGQGLGTGLITEAESLMVEAGCHSSSLEVEKSNVAARRLYERLGYSVTGESSAVWDEPDDESRLRPVEHLSWVMSKEL
jgi:ribosomal protein S18 acetylase RimI-like enzyme